MLDVTLIPVLSDNYSYILQSQTMTAIIDPGEATPLVKFLENQNIKPDIIYLTHHHFDHIDGAQEIKDKYGCPIIGPAAEENKIKILDTAITKETALDFGDEDIQIFETPGHTLGHICYYFKQSKILFSGDTIFSLGCGRLFEGTAEQMFTSIEQLKALPDNTQIYCGHEYTSDNARFCLSVMPDNQDLLTRIEDIKHLRQKEKPTVPTTIGLEKNTNIFMMCNTVQEFKKYRDLKDNF